MATVNGFKMEEDFKIKHDPDAGSPASMADIDMYEDDGELIMPPGTPQGWLMRLPKELWQVLSEHQTDEDFQIGQIKVWKQPKGKEKFRFEINASIPNTQMIPKQYDMMGSSQATKSTFVFSEKDLEGYKPRQPGRNMAATHPDPLKSIDSKAGGPVKVEKPKSRYRTIPKKTAVIGGVAREFICSPRDNEEFRAIQAKKELAEKEKHTSLRLLAGEEANNLHTGAMNLNGSVDAFIKTAAEKKKRTQDNKAVRMERANLLEVLLGLFKEYKFWSMSALKVKTKQPEAWLKEVLSSIATLVKSGTAANTYTLNETMAELQSALNDEGNGEVKVEVLAKVKTEDVAPVDKDAEDDDEDMDDEDDEGDFEDV